MHFRNLRNLLSFIIVVCIIGCTKYVANNKSSSNSSSTSTSGSSGSSSSSSNSSGSGATPLGSGGSSSGSSGSGSSSSGSSSGSGSSTGGGIVNSGSGSTGGSSSGSGSSGGTGSGSGSGGSTGSGSSGTGGSTGSGGSTIGSGSSGSGGSGTGGNTLPVTYLQGLNYMGIGAVSNVSMFADSATLLSAGYYTSIYAGNVKVGAYYNNNQVLNIGNYLLTPYNFYSLIIFDAPQVSIAGTILPNGNTTPGDKRAYIRFIDLDPSTKNANMICSAVSYMDSSWFMNRRYLDHQTDTSLTQYKDIYATTADINFKINNQVVKSFQYAFEQGKKYTIIAIADGNNLSKYYIARHN